MEALDRGMRPTAELHYIKGENNVIADALSRLGLKEEEFSLDAFALDAFPFGPGDQDFPKEYPVRLLKTSPGLESSQSLTILSKTAY